MDNYPVLINQGPLDLQTVVVDRLLTDFIQEDFPSSVEHFDAKIAINWLQLLPQDTYHHL